MKYILGVIIIIILLIIVIPAQRKADSDNVQSWCQKNGYTLISQEECFFEYGPFYYKGKGERIYKLIIQDNTQTNRTFYMRTNGLFPNDYEEVK